MPNHLLIFEKKNIYIHNLLIPLNLFIIDSVLVKTARKKVYFTSMEMGAHEEIKSEWATYDFINFFLLALEAKK
jgi:hypothetical protein